MSTFPSRSRCETASSDAVSIKQPLEKEMSKIVYDGKNYELESLRERMDKDLIGKIDRGFSDQEFFDNYLIIHYEKHGDRFTVD